MNVKKSIVTASIALALAGGMTACKESNEATNEAINDPTETTTSQVVEEAAETTTARPLTRDEKFVQIIHDRGIFLYAKDEQIVKTAKLGCEALDAGNSIQDLMTVTRESGGISAKDAGYFVGASVIAYCPQHAGLAG